MAQPSRVKYPMRTENRRMMIGHRKISNGMSNSPVWATQARASKVEHGRRRAWSRQAVESSCEGLGRGRESARWSGGVRRGTGAYRERGYLPERTPKVTRGEQRGMKGKGGTKYLRSGFVDGWIIENWSSPLPTTVGSTPRRVKRYGGCRR